MVDFCVFMCHNSLVKRRGNEYMPTANPYTSSNHSTEIALSIMELLAGSRGGMRLKDICSTINANSSTVSRFLNTLVKCGYIEQDPGAQSYRMTYKICRLGEQVRDNTPLQAITHPYLTAISDRFNEACCVSVERDMQMVYIDTVSPQGQSLMSRQQIGGTSPMHCTGNGKLLLLNYSTEKLDELIAVKGLEAYTPNTITTREKLVTEIENIRSAGYALDTEECELGVRCLAYPIYDCSGKVVAGLSVTGPASRMTDAVMSTMHDMLADTAGRISQSLGFIAE